ncbi:hypothetical protein Pint_18498 [Pistacia integerrima]|uniref:Uncharacterized protein n=1 Tax=Pistacia integerrima TaxID=434235 RepID=A0ACC0YTG3_9ROSI|nr:hypothetical protein Pint_18498 [Pistacia integerrima]
MGLNDPYGVARSQILNTKPLPSLNKAYALIIREEWQRAAVAKMGPIEGAAYSAKVFKRLQGCYPANWDRRRKSGNKFKQSKATVDNVAGATTEKEA